MNSLPHTPKRQTDATPKAPIRFLVGVKRKLEEFVLDQKRTPAAKTAKRPRTEATPNTQQTPTHPPMISSPKTIRALPFHFAPVDAASTPGSLSARAPASGSLSSRKHRVIGKRRRRDQPDGSPVNSSLHACDTHTPHVTKRDIATQYIPNHKRSLSDEATSPVGILSPVENLKHKTHKAISKFTPHRQFHLQEKQENSPCSLSSKAATLGENELPIAQPRITATRARDQNAL